MSRDVTPTVASSIIQTCGYVKPIPERVFLCWGSQLQKLWPKGFLNHSGVLQSKDNFPVRLYITKYTVVLVLLSSNKNDDFREIYFFMNLSLLPQPTWDISYETGAGRNPIQSVVWAMVILAQDQSPVLIFSRVWQVRLRSWKPLTKEHGPVALTTAVPSLGAQRSQHKLSCTESWSKVTPLPLISKDFLEPPVGKLGWNR